MMLVLELHDGFPTLATLATDFRVASLIIFTKIIQNISILELPTGDYLYWTGNQFLATIHQ